MAFTFRSRKLDVAEAAALGRNTAFEFDFNHLAAAGSTTSSTANLLDTVAAKFEISKVAYHLPVAFVGASITNLTVSVGVTAATTDFLNAVEVCASTPAGAGQAAYSSISTTTVDETYATPESTVLTNLRTWANQVINSRSKILTSSTNLVATVTATGANLSALTAGRIVILAQVVDLSKFDARGA